jgi:hypothetical protein
MQATHPNVVVAAPKQDFTVKTSGRFLEEMPILASHASMCTVFFQSPMRLSKCLCYSNDIDRTLQCAALP